MCYVAKPSRLRGHVRTRCVFRSLIIILSAQGGWEGEGWGLLRGNQDNERDLDRLVEADSSAAAQTLTLPDPWRSQTVSTVLLNNHSRQYLDVFLFPSIKLIE